MNQATMANESMTSEAMTNTTMTNATTANESMTNATLTNSRLNSDSLNVVTDRDCDVTVVQGKALDSQRACFELGLLTLNQERSESTTVALPTPVANFSIGIQTNNGTEKTAIPHSMALTAGLIAHGYIPDDWLCGLMTLPSNDSQLTYITTFDSKGIYGRSEFSVSNLNDRIKSDSSNLVILQKQLQRTQPRSLETQRTLEVLYLDSENLELDESSQEQIISRLSDALDIMVEPLPAPSSDLISAGMRWLSSEVK